MDTEVTPAVKLKALKAAIALYCCLKNGGGGGGGMSDGEIADSLDISGPDDLLSLLDMIADQLLVKAGYTVT